MPLNSAIAGGTIFPARFVRLDATREGRAVQCGAGEATFGISQLGARRHPYIDDTDPPRAALVGEPIGFYTMGEVGVALEVAVATTPGMRLKSDTNGKGVEASAGEEFGAEAIDICAVGDFCKVRVITGSVPA